MDFLTAADAEQLGGECYRLIIALVRLNKRPDGTVPSCEEVRGLIEERVQRSPRLRQFPYQPPGYSGLPAWADGQDFDIDDHLVSADTDCPADRHQVKELLAEWMTTPIDETKPLWRIQYVETEDGAALLWKSGHAIADGVGTLALLAMLLFDVTGEPVREEAARWEPARCRRRPNSRRPPAPREPRRRSSSRPRYRRRWPSSPALSRSRRPRPARRR